MAPDFILAGCNPVQKNAVMFDHATHGPLLILAGAGSGKTSVLTRRILWLILREGVPSSQILALTFTAKAAGEMRERLDQQAPKHQSRLCTFHSLALHLIRENYGGQKGWALLGFSKQPVLDDQEETTWEHRLIRSGLSAKALKRENLFASPLNPGILKLQESVFREGCIVFEDLIWLSIRLLEMPQVSNIVQTRFQYILVDEYQDINPSQYQLVRLLIGNRPTLFAVGDDDQAIYGFRGADIGNILRFQNDYPGCCILKLEWNYRSTPRILEVANRIFLDKPVEFRKKLRPGSGRNDLLFRENRPVMLKEFRSPMEEMEWIGSVIRQTKNQFGIPYKAFAILVRYHLQREWYVLSLESMGIPILKTEIDGVQIETIHASKGLQYPVVFYAGLAEGISPAKSEGKRDAVLRQREEERRLFYVGVTRAECQLYLLFCKRRHWRGKLCEFRKSPFLECLPRKDRSMNTAKIIVAARIAAYMAWSMVIVFWKRICNPKSVASWVESRLAAWAKFCLQVNGYVHTIEGQEHLAQVDWSRPVFVVSNHQSYMDIPAVLVTMDHKLGFIAKQELSRIPFLGFWMKKIGCLLIKRGKAGVGVDVANAIKTMGTAPNIVVFPEGTRSRNGQMSPFKSGAFRMAMDHRGILIPMVLIGSRAGWEKRKKGGRDFPLHSKILVPIDCGELLQENPQATHKDLTQMVRSAMENALLNCSHG